MGPREYSITNLGNSPYLIKLRTHVTGSAAFINSSATQSKWAAISPKKATKTVCLGFCINPFSMHGGVQ